MLNKTIIGLLWSFGLVIIFHTSRAQGNSEPGSQSSVNEPAVNAATVKLAVCYANTKNRRSTNEKLQLRKYDPVVRRHVMFKETKI